MATDTDVSLFQKAVTSPPPSPQRKEQPAEQKVVGSIIIAEEYEGKFIERQHRTDALEYARTGEDPGLILIFNQEKFLGDREKERVGTRRDVNEIITCFQRQGFNIEKDNILHDATTDQIKEKLDDVSKMDLSQRNCLIVFFLTHGSPGDQLETYDGRISTSDVWRRFLDCPTLDNKPKLFVFQACKGSRFSSTFQTGITEASRIVHDDIFRPTYLGPDMMVVYSTVEDNVSFRSTLTGTWFIQEFCKIVTAYGKRDDVASLVTRTTKCVSGNYYHYEQDVHKKQMSVYMSTLTRKFYLNSNKDRAMVLMSRSYYDDIFRLVKEIKDSL